MIRERSHVDEQAGRRILDRRTELGLSQREAAEGVCSPATLARLETGSRRPSVEMLEAIARRLQSTAGELGMGVAGPAVDLDRGRRHVATLARELAELAESTWTSDLRETLRDLAATARAAARSLNRAAKLTPGSTRASGVSVKTDDAATSGR